MKPRPIEAFALTLVVERLEEKLVSQRALAEAAREAGDAEELRLREVRVLDLCNTIEQAKLRLPLPELPALAPEQQERAADLLRLRYEDRAHAAVAERDGALGLSVAHAATLVLLDRCETTASLDVLQAVEVQMLLNLFSSVFSELGFADAS